MAVIARIYIGVWPLNVSNWAQTATGIGAKVACSHHYISGLDEADIRSDLESYFGVMSLLDLEFDAASQTVQAEILGQSLQKARFRKGIGCSLSMGDSTALDSLRVAALEADEQVPWPAGEAVTTINATAQSATEALLRADNAEGQATRALLVVQGGQIIAEAYAEGIDDKTPLLGWSMAKSITAMLIGQLEMTGVLKTDQTDLVAEWRGTPRQEISLQQLLTMTSGLEFREIYLPGTDATKMLFGSYRAAEYAWQQELEHEPSTYFSYSSGTANLLADLYVRKMGGPQQAYDALFQNLLTPLAMTNTYLEPDPSGTIVGSSYVYASARDWARLGQTLLNDGALNGHQVLPPGWVKRATSPNSSANYSAYGYQLWLNTGESALWPDLPADSYAMTGNRAQRVMVIPSMDTVIVRLGWSADEYPDSEKFARLLRKIKAAK